jgi:gliding motility-associated-like protein
MKTKIIFIAFLFNFYLINLFSQHIIGDNLVPNPGFEGFTTCPNDISQISKAIPWDPSRGNNDNGSTDYLNICTNHANLLQILSIKLPNSGSACAGICPFFNPSNYPDYREYLEVKLKNKFVKAKKYCGSFYTVLSMYGNIAVENLGILITQSYVCSYNPLAHGETFIDSIPQICNKNGLITDTINWTKVSGLYIANGGEEYITIGNFKRDSQTNILPMDDSTMFYAYYLIDDVSVCECSFEINLGQDTSLCEGESILLNPKLPSASYTWQDSSHAATYEVKQPGTYWVRAYVAEYDVTTSDTIVISAEDENICNPPLIIPNFITPNGDGNNDDFSIGNATDYELSLQIFNRWGNMIYQNTSYQNDFNCKSCGEGVYYYLLIAKNKRNGNVKEYKGSVTVMK